MVSVLNLTSTIDSKTFLLQIFHPNWQGFFNAKKNGQLNKVTAPRLLNSLRHMRQNDKNLSERERPKKELDEDEPIKSLWQSGKLSVSKK